MKPTPDIIIIDDDPFITELIESYLAPYDLLIQTYNNPVQALEQVIHHRPRIVFMDLKMPEMRGDQVIVKLSEKYIFQTTSVFLVTATVLDETEYMKIMTLGFDHVISKPIREIDIYNAVVSIFGTIPLKKISA